MRHRTVAITRSGFGINGGRVLVVAPPGMLGDGLRGLRGCAPTAAAFSSSRWLVWKRSDRTYNGPLNFLAARTPQLTLHAHVHRALESPVRDAARGLNFLSALIVAASKSDSSLKD